MQERGIAPDVARVWTIAAGELEEALQTTDQELLPLSRAARESGYSVDHLSRLIRGGKVTNAGRKGAPRIRRADLPRRPIHDVAVRARKAYDAEADARSLLAGRLQQGGVHDQD